MRALRNVVLLATFSITAACSSIGPKTITRDQFDYGGAISTAWKEQLLSAIDPESLFAMVQVMLSLTESSTTAKGPVVSISNSWSVSSAQRALGAALRESTAAAEQWIQGETASQVSV